MAVILNALGLSAMSVLHAALLTDNFGDRSIASGTTVTFMGDSTSATLEVGEPSHGGFSGHSVWGAWTAPDNGNVTITTSGSAFDTVLAVYVGNALNTLLPVAQNNDVQSGFTWSSVTFPTKSGITYSFAVDGNPNSSAGKGAVVVNVNFTAAAQPSAEVGTDSFAARPTLPASVQAIGVCDTRLATIELDEPDHISFRNHTVWWRWVVPSNGVVTIDTLASSFDTALTVYVGGSLSNLTEVAINNNAPNVIQSRAAFRTKAGQEYQIMVDGSPNSVAGQGNLILNLVLQPDFNPSAVPGADAFANRGLLAGTDAIGVVNNTFFGLDANEPNFGSFRKHTAWWLWTAPADGPVEISTSGSDFDTFLGVYTGASLTSLQLIANNNNATNVTWSDLKFNAQRGVDYQIMVDGDPNSSAGQGNISLSVSQAVSAVNTLAIYTAVEVEIPGNQGVSYQLQSSTDLINWQNVDAAILGTGQPVRILDSTRGTNKKYYRYLTIP